MVDKDILKQMKTGKKPKKKDKKSKSGKSSGGASGNTDPYTLEEEAKLHPEHMVVTDSAEEIAGEAELNFDKHTGSVSMYKRNQVKECKELYDEVRKNVNEFGGDLQKFTAVFQSIIMNLAQNRHGIAMTLMEEFDMSKAQAQSEAHAICKKAGEVETIDWTIQELTKQLME